MKCVLICCLLALRCVSGWGQTDCTYRDKDIFETYRAKIEASKELPLNEIIVMTAKFFLTTPYVGATLEKEPEQLVVNLRELDCTTLVETVLALSLAVKEDSLTFETFAGHLCKIRYREGKIDGYTSRNHYFTDWIVENERQGIVKDITREIGGKPFSPAVSFMSAHPDKYRQLAKDSSLVPVMKEREQEINSRSYAYIPKGEINRLAAKIQNGDIVCFTTSIPGLDISHVGYAYWQQGRLTFIHASTSSRRVMVNPETLAAYCAGIKHNTGIMVVRPLPTGKKQ